MKAYEIRACLCVVLMVSFMGIMLAADKPVSKPIQPVVVAARAKTPPVVNGKLDDDCWRQALPVTTFYIYPNGGTSAVRTEGRICYDDARLYVGVTCFLAKGVKPKGKMKPHDAYIFQDDEVEIMIDPGRSQTTYYQFCINAYGATYDGSRAQGGAAHDREWNGQWVGKAHQEPGVYSVEVAIPFCTLGITPKVGSEWGLNICRTSITPYELSSIAGGAFNEAKKFAILRRLDVNLRKYCFQVGPAYPVVRRGPKGCTAVLHTPIKNLTGSRKRLRLEVRQHGADGLPIVDTRTITLRHGEDADITLERVEMTPLFPRRTDIYARSTLQTTALVLKDATTNETYVYASIVPSTFGEKLRVCWEPIRINVVNPWKPRMTPAKTPAIELSVHCAIPSRTDDVLSLEVSLTSVETGKSVATRTIAQPKPVNRLRFDARALAWGAYKVRAKLRTTQGEDVFSTEAVATVLPGGKHRIEMLNMLVAELMNTRKRGLQPQGDIAFMNPRHGWCFFRFTGECAVTLDQDTRSLGAARRDGSPIEVMRLLPAGKHVLHVKGQAEELIVRAIPALVYNAHETGTQIGPFGIHTWERLRKCILPNCNMIESVGRLHPKEVAEWRDAGKRWIRNASRPGLGGRGDEVENAYYLWQRSPGYSHPLFGGIQIDEFSPSTYSEQGYITLARQAGLLAEDPKFRGRFLIPFACRVYGSSGGLVFMKAILAAGWPFSEEWYIGERPTEAEARETIRRRMIDSARGWNATLPGSVRRMIVTLMYSALPYCTTNTCPGVDFKVHLDMQMHLLANEPIFHGLWGVQPYRSNYADLDTLFWMGRLMRHYCIEGSTERLSSDPYELPHLLNPDFDDGTNHWQIRPVESTSIRVGAYSGYGALEGRYNRKGSQGDRFLLMTRSAKRPNTFSQEVKQLEPGRLYSLRMYTGDYDDLRAGKSRKTLHAVSIRLDGVEVLPGQINAFQYPFRSCLAAGPFNRQRPFWMNFHWRVFRAKSRSARLTVTDWQSEDTPGGPVGQSLMFNFIELQPYAGGEPIEGSRQ